MNKQDNIPERSGLRRLLDDVFGKWYIELPVLLGLALGAYLLNCFLGARDDRDAMIKATPIACAAAFLFTLFLLILLDRLPFVPDYIVDRSILSFGSVFLLIGIGLTIVFLINIPYNYTPVLPALFTVLAAITLFSKIRKK